MTEECDGLTEERKGKCLSALSSINCRKAESCFSPRDVEGEEKESEYFFQRAFLCQTWQSCGKHF